jgi:hypothetical protein
MRWLRVLGVVSGGERSSRPDRTSRDPPSASTSVVEECPRWKRASRFVTLLLFVGLALFVPSGFALFSDAQKCPRDGKPSAHNTAGVNADGGSIPVHETLKESQVATGQGQERDTCESVPPASAECSVPRQLPNLKFKYFDVNIFDHFRYNHLHSFAAPRFPISLKMDASLQFRWCHHQ